MAPAERILAPLAVLGLHLLLLANVAVHCPQLLHVATLRAVCEWLLSICAILAYVAWVLVTTFWTGNAWNVFHLLLFVIHLFFFPLFFHPFSQTCCRFKEVERCFFIILTPPKVRTVCCDPGFLSTRPRSTHSCTALLAPVCWCRWLGPTPARESAKLRYVDTELQPIGWQMDEEMEDPGGSGRCFDSFLLSSPFLPLTFVYIYIYLAKLGWFPRVRVLSIFVVSRIGSIKHSQNIELAAWAVLRETYVLIEVLMLSWRNATIFWRGIHWEFYCLL